MQTEIDTRSRRAWWLRRTRAHPLPFDALIAPIVDPAYIRLESSNAKDAEKLLMSFDTMNFKIPSPTSTSSKKRSSIFSEKDAKATQVGDKATSSAAAASSTASVLAANSAAAEELRKEQARVSASSSSASSLSISAPTDSLLSVLNVGSSTPKSSSSEKKIGSYSPAARKLRLQKFHEKRKNRTWKKSIKYDCRKKLADDRPRIKGRFVRVLENAGDAKTGAASRSAASPPSSTSAGYASPTSPTGALAPPVMAAPAKPQVSAVPRVAASCASTLASGAKQTPAASVAKPAPVAAPAPSAAALPFARMIASV
ncbi:unnamed protein product [Phytophthora lilii]|uniref:Unnamed protein product n=1 Tax=Phytophthora lilii TaxID=2077276 RepID=A0A9W6YF60_9STRA|nr:unnamed protein product [Phytophthora lilii]